MKTTLTVLMIATLCMAASSAAGTEFTGVSVGTWTRMTDPAGEDVRYLEAIQGENVLLWRTGTSTLRRATYTYSGGVVTLGTPASPTGLTSGDHASILNLGSGNLEGYFHPTPNPGVPTQTHATSTDGGVTWGGETPITYPFPTPGMSDSGTTGGGGIIEVAGQRRIYAQNNFGDIIMYTTTAGSAGPLTSAGRLIAVGASGPGYSFQNQSPSGDAYKLPTGDVLYFYTDGEGSESTLGAVGILLLDSTGLAFTDVRDNFVNITDAALIAAGATQLDEMTISNVSIVGNQMNFLLWIDGDSTTNGSNEDIFYTPVSLTFNQPVPEPATMALMALGGIATLLRRRRNK